MNIYEAINSLGKRLDLLEESSNNTVYKIIDELKTKLSKLESMSHEPREFIKCNECKTQVKEKVNASNTSVSNKNISNRSDSKASNDDTGGLPSKKLKKQAGRQAVGASKKSNGKKVAKKKKTTNAKKNKNNT